MSKLAVSLQIGLVVVFLSLSAMPALAAAESDDWTLGDYVNGRYFRLTRPVELGLRFRLMQNDDGKGNHEVTNSEIQYSFLGAAEIRFDDKGRFTLQGLAQSGAKITSSWNNTGLGETGDPQSLKYIYLKQLFFQGDITKDVRVQIGGLGIDRGRVFNEIVHFDNDVYTMGFRVNLSNVLGLNRITLTAANIGGFETPNVWDRFGDFGKFNYYQLLLEKDFGTRAIAAFELSKLEQDIWLRQGLRLNVEELKVLSFLTAQAYERIDEHGDVKFGFAFLGERQIGKNLSVSVCYANIDLLYGGLNGDRYNIGERFCGGAVYKISNHLSLEAFVTQSLERGQKMGNWTRGDAILKIRF